MTPAEIKVLFTRPDGQYHFARWRRPIAPVVFGVEDATLATVKAAIEAVLALAGHPVADIDPEQGANLMIFFVRDWAELAGVPDLDRLVPGLTATLDRLERAEAAQFWHFRFEADGAIRACFSFLRMTGALADRAAEDLALELAVRSALLWADGAVSRLPVLQRDAGVAELAPAIAALIRAAYDPVLPAAAQDASHALRLAARQAAALAGPEAGGH